MHFKLVSLFQTHRKCIFFLFRSVNAMGMIIILIRLRRRRRVISTGELHCLQGG